MVFFFGLYLTLPDCPQPGNYTNAIVLELNISTLTTGSLHSIPETNQSDVSEGRSRGR
jgi:hypothetical protein